MGHNVYEKAKELLKPIKGMEIGLVKLRSIIIRNVGGDKRTITNYLNIMIETKLLRDVGNAHFKVL